MTTARETLNELISIGEQFTYNNFRGDSGYYGYPNSLSEDWIEWRTRVLAFTKARFGEDSIPFRTISQGLSIRLTGNGEDKFRSAKSYILGGLKGALAALDDESIKEISQVSFSATGESYSKKIFIVHGHDEKSKNELEIFIKGLGLDPIVLHRQPDEGQTILEKLEKHSDTGYAFILLTPDDIAYPADQEQIEEAAREKEFRARANVIFEFGYFVGRLSRKRVCCLYRGDVVLPSDISGFVYKKFIESIEECGYAIMKELKAAGYDVSL